MLVTDVGDQTYWWQVSDVGDRFRILVTDLIHWENHQHYEESHQHNDSVTNIGHYHKITNITLSTTSLLFLGWWTRKFVVRSHTRTLFVMDVGDRWESSANIWWDVTKIFHFHAVTKTELLQFNDPYNAGCTYSLINLMHQIVTMIVYRKLLYNKYYFHL